MKSLKILATVGFALCLSIFMVAPASADEVCCSDYELQPHYWPGALGGGEVYLHTINESLNANVIVDGWCAIASDVTIDGNIMKVDDHYSVLAVDGRVTGNIEGGPYLWLAVLGELNGNIYSSAYLLDVVRGGVLTGGSIKGEYNVIHIDVGAAEMSSDIEVKTGYTPHWGWNDAVNLHIGEYATFNGNVKEEGPGGIWVWMYPDAVFNGNIIEQGLGDVQITSGPYGVENAYGTLNGNIMEEGPGYVYVYLAEEAVFNGDAYEKGEGFLYTWGFGTFNGNTKEEDEGWCMNYIARFNGNACE